MERKFKFSIGEFYHIYNRGAEKRTIFIEPSDYERFVKLLYLCNGVEPTVMKLVQRLPLDELFNLDVGGKIVDIGAYCLMSNHFHLILHERQEGGISTFVQRICTGYSLYFNKKYKHSGTLFQGPFKATHLGDDNYLKYMYSYLHLNPIKIIDRNWKEKGIDDINRAKDFLNSYRYSSYLEYLGLNRPEGRILNKEEFPGYFSDKKEFEDFIEDWLSYKDIEGEELSTDLSKGSLWTG